MTHNLRDVKDFWEQRSCGEELYLGGKESAHYEEQSRQRYVLEPYIEKLAGFAETAGKTVLELGVGLGADHQRFAQARASAFGMDLTSRSVGHVRERFRLAGLNAQLLVGDGQRLPYRSESVDVVYSWGVIHHAPNPQQVIEETFRVLKPGGSLRIMIYHKWSMVGLMLWTRYALMKLKPFMSLREVYGQYLESPGTKAYSKSEARRLLHQFQDVHIDTVLTHGDLLASNAGQWH